MLATIFDVVAAEQGADAAGYGLCVCVCVCVYVYMYMRVCV